MVIQKRVRSYTAMPNRKSRHVPDIGKRIGLLQVVDLADPYIWRGKAVRLRWRCECACGGITEVRDDLLRSGRTRSCGCEKVRVTRERVLRHGQRAGHKLSPEYEVWRSLRRRGREKTLWVVEAWLNDDDDTFQKFLNSVGPRPSSDHHLVHDNPDHPIGPENAVWRPKAPRIGISRRFLVINGETFSLRQAAANVGLPVATLQRRLSRGWTETRALQPLKDPRNI